MSLPLLRHPQAAALLAAALALACGDSSDSCLLGAEACSCTSAGTCEAGLSCARGICKRDDPGASGNAGDPGLPGVSPGIPPGVPEPAAPAIQPLGGSTIVFEKFYRHDSQHWASHLYRFDLDTGEKRLITKLDDDLGRGDLVEGLSVSADRRWIAFASDSFRIN